MISSGSSVRSVLPSCDIRSFLISYFDTCHIFRVRYIIKTTWSRAELENADEDTIHAYAAKVARRIYG